MKDSDQIIEKVLAGLRDAESPTGMEHRILEQVQNRAAAGIQQSWPTGLTSRIAVRPVAYAAALACIAAIVLAVPYAIHLKQHTPIQSAKLIPAMPLPPAFPSAEGQSTKPQTEPRMPARILRVSRRQRAGRAMQSIDTEELLAVREMNAPSRPAPPLPLTEQEKLLVRFVRTSTPEQLAAIDPAKLAAHDEQEKADFDKFFRRSPKEQSANTNRVKDQPVKEKPTEEAWNKSGPAI